jgi:hypothetical protein
MTRLGGAILACAIALLGAFTGTASSGAGASTPTVTCPRLSSTVSLAFGAWNASRELFALVGSEGARREGGYVVLVAATPTDASVDRVCRRTRPRRSTSSTQLSKAYRYRRAGENVYFRAADGEILFATALHRASFTVLVRRRAVGVEYLCILTRGVTARVKSVRGGSELRVLAGQEVLATAVVRRAGESFFRISTRCDKR